VMAGTAMENNSFPMLPVPKSAWELFLNQVASFRAKR